MAEEAPADASTANAAQLLCPRCDTLVLRQGAGRWATHEKLLPKTSVPPEGWPTPEDAVEALGEFWAVDDMYSFVNIAFSRTVGQDKYLCCADCEFGPLGYHELQPAELARLCGESDSTEGTGGGGRADDTPVAVADDPESLAAAKTPFFLAAARVVGATAERPAKPMRAMDSAAAAAAGIDLSKLMAQPQLQRPEQLPPAVDEDPSQGETITLVFFGPMLGLYLEDQAAPESARAAGWPGGVETAIRRFNPVPAPGPPPGGEEEAQEEHFGPGEAEASGQLQLGDVVLSIHGVDVRGIGTEDTVELVKAAPRPFEMRFLRRCPQ